MESERVYGKHQPELWRKGRSQVAPRTSSTDPGSRAVVARESCLQRTRRRSIEGHPGAPWKPLRRERAVLTSVAGPLLGQADAVSAAVAALGGSHASRAHHRLSIGAGGWVSASARPFFGLTAATASHALVLAGALSGGACIANRWLGRGANQGFDAVPLARRGGTATATATACASAAAAARPTAAGCAAANGLCATTTALTRVNALRLVARGRSACRHVGRCSRRTAGRVHRAASSARATVRFRAARAAPATDTRAADTRTSRSHRAAGLVGGAAAAGLTAARLVRLPRVGR